MERLLRRIPLRLDWRFGCRHKAGDMARSVRTFLMMALLGLSPVFAGSVSAQSQSDRMTPEVRAVQATRATVVNIRGKKTVSEPARRFDEDAARQVNGMGTGVLVDQRGYIVTNFHVVEGVSNIQVTLPDNRTFDASLIARDAKTDIAVIKLISSEEFPTVNLGNSDDLMLAERVIAIGNAYGYENSVSVGVVSELHRTVQVSDDQIYYDLIQTDAAINPGNSGGPLLNINGEMIGLNVAVRVGAQGIAFAIPVNQVMEIVGGLIAERTGGVSIHGVTGRTVLDGTESRFVVDQVAAGSAANRAGLQAGDRVDSISGQAVHSRFDFERAFLANDSDGELEIEFTRDGSSISASLALDSEARTIAGEDPIWDVLGVRLSPVSSDDFRLLSERYTGGMRVTEVREGGPASRRGIKSNDVLVGIHIWETTSLKDLRYILSRPEVLNSEQGVSFFLLRGREEFFGNIRLSSQTVSTAASR